MDFGEALKLLKEGKKLFREGWNGIKRGLEMFVEYVPDAISGAYLYKSHLNMIYNTEAPFVVVGWLASQEDMLSNDWEVS